MKNITVSVDDEVYRQARIAAAEADASVSALVRDFLTALSQEKNCADPRSTIAAVVDRIRRRHPDFDPTNRLNRDEIHAR